LYPVDVTKASHSTFTLFMGTSLAFTAFPLLARILTAFRLLDTPFGEHVLSIAAIDDILAWCTLALTLSHAGGASDANGVYTALITIAYLLVLIFVTRPCLRWISRQLRFQQKVPGELNRDYVCVLILCLCASAIWTEISGIHAFFGAFTFGLVVPKEKQADGESVVDILAPKIELLIVEFFLPLYFAYSGLRTTLGALDTAEVWGMAILVIIVASLGKIIPVTLMTRLMTWYRGIGDDFEQEDMDWEEEKRQRETAQREVTQKGTSDDLEMATISKDGDDSSSFSYQTYQTPAHKNEKDKLGDPIEEEKTNPSDDPAPAPSSSSSPSGRSFPSSSSGADRSKCYSWRTCLSVGMLMNTTGLVTLIALNIGLDRGILGQKVFSMMVLMALVTTFMTSPIFHVLFYKPYVYERNIKREARRKEREIAEIMAGRSEESVAASEDEREANRVAREEEEQKQAEDDGDSLSISSKTKKKKKKGLTLNSPYSTNSVYHHVLNRGRDIKIATLAPTAELTHSLTPPPHPPRRASRSSNEQVGGSEDGGGGGGGGESYALRVSSSDGELADLRSSNMDSDVYSNKTD
jgi:Kef-type K+ transport system membrane component KefB